MEKNKLGLKASKEISNSDQLDKYKSKVIEKLTKNGFRITKQRLLLLDIILESDCSCCKEIYYKASKIDKKIGAATVYRMMNTLENIGALNRNNQFKLSCSENCSVEAACIITFDDNTQCRLTRQRWNHVIKAGLKEYGYLSSQNIKSIEMQEQ